jgi:hypothetical protein
MAGTCKECDRLLQEYLEATKAHLKIIGEHQIALLQQKSRGIIALEPLCIEFGMARALAREALKNHEVTAHGPETDG